ncbi:unnamed protein product [marine sediment metagenome]|uniref:Uncharacterized protein n=1 Tax=marine sediment metagenome TaxID=412755 RepID=X0STQ5_9ZZZZ
MDAEVIQKAKALGLNISKISENAIIAYIERLEGISVVKSPENSPDNIAYVRLENDWCDRRGSNPGPLRGRQESYH